MRTLALDRKIWKAGRAGSSQESSRPITPHCAPRDRPSSPRNTDAPRGGRFWGEWRVFERRIDVSMWMKVAPDQAGKFIQRWRLSPQISAIL
ncbi:hypothetical protein Hypma_001745 [Hypsizygus marmoreus]|uniref:Uncharacterized protein n=1 Tax=Hypsizygus marmoreus TaxID=39966 RepID=A0A369J5B0_HYPMA|nr:hypothetical protein Hypma_001745 [Hypsizygus marmoreus]